MPEPEHIDLRRAALIAYDDRPAAGPTRTGTTGPRGRKARTIMGEVCRDEGKAAGCSLMSRATRRFG